MSDFILIALGSIISLLVLLCIYFYRQISQIGVDYKLLFFRKEILQKIFNQGTSLSCYWFDGDRHIECSRELLDLLEFNTDHMISIDDFIKILGPSTFSPFQKALTHLNDYGGDFMVNLSIFEGKLNLIAHGRKLFLEGSLTPGQGIPRYVNIIAFTNLTPHIQEQVLQAQAFQSKEIDLLRTVFDGAPIALWARDKHGRINFCNAPYAGSLETSIHRVIAENKELIVSNGKQMGTFDLSRKAIELFHKQTIRTHAVIAGQRRLLEIAEIPLGDSGQTVGYALDITEIEDIEMELDQANQAHRGVLDLLSTAIIIYGPDQKLIYYNLSYKKMFDWEESWLAAQPTYSEVMEDLRQRRQIAEFADFQAHKKSRQQLFNSLFQPIHETIYQPDGRIMRMIISPHPLGGIMYLFDDISDTLALERGYKTLLAVQKETLDNLYEGLAVFGTDNRLRLFNPALSKILELEESVLAGTPHISEILDHLKPRLMAQNESEPLADSIQHTLAARQTCRQLLHLDDDVTIQYIYVPLPDGSHLLSFVDISDQQKLENSLKERTEYLEHTERLKNSIISNVSYELRAPLNSIVGFSDMLINAYFGELNEKQLDYCQGILDSADKLMSLINDMIDLANIEAGTLNLDYQEIEIETFINSVSHLVQNRASDQGLELITHIHCTRTLSYFDPKQIKHALFNLLNNAIKFTPSGGKITITAEDNPHNSQFIDIKVNDTGVGIKDGDREKIFGLFEHGDYTQTSQKGAGIGLTIVKSLIELHKGHVTLESRENEGTTVICTFPYDMREAAQKIRA